MTTRDTRDTGQRLSLPKEAIRIVLLENIHEDAERLFRQAGYTNVDRRREALTGELLHDAIADAHIVGIRSRTQLDEAALDAARRLFAVGCFCIGTDQVALEQAAARGIAVFNAPHSNTRSVAELVIGETVMLLRRIPNKSRLCHEGGWDKSADGSHELRGKTMGIVGYGHIGSQVSIMAEALGMRVIYHDIIPVLPLGNARSLSGLDELLHEADVVTLHVPDTAATRNLMSAARIASMRRGSYLINASRGSVVDLDALAAALRDEHIAGCAIDVFPVEPKAKGERFVSPLQGLPNVILTPHIGGSTAEAQAAIGFEVASKLITWSDRGTSLGAVNFPELGLAEHEGGHRVLHIHRSVPGIMRQINDVFARLGLNVLGQHLRTRDGIGYVVLDTEAVEAGEILPPLREIEGTIRARILY
ncbi:MAG: phosphoglycerate dehydrogenase [Planctomycetota bacterium]